MAEKSETVNIRTCRLCLVASFSNGVTLDSAGVWLQMYEFCFGVIMTPEDNPRKLCEVCANKLKEFTEFKNNALKSDKLWKSIITASIEGSEIKLEKDKIDNESNDGLIEDLHHYDNSVNSIQEAVESININLELLRNFEDEDDINDNDITPSLKCPKEEIKPDMINNYESSCSNHSFNATCMKKKKRGKYKKRKKVKENAKSQGCDTENIVNNEVIIKEHVEKQDDKIDNKYKPDSLTHDCGLCDKIFTESKKLQQHLTEHSTHNDLCCKLCDFTGRDFADMTTHRHNHLSKDGRKVVLQCHLCNYKPKVRLRLQFHYRETHLKLKGGLCSVCNKQFKKYISWRNHERLHVTDKYICDICGRRFLFRNLIIVHLQNHSDYKGYVCDLCGRLFKRASNLRLHLQTRHDDNHVKCSHCDITFKNKRGLDKHLKDISDDKPYQCEVCSKRYSKQSVLKQHMIWHADNRPFACDFCGASFKAKSTLKAHSVKHTGILAHKCPDCTKGFATLRQLVVHSSVHTGVRRHRCPHCPSSFHGKKVLMNHCEKKHVTEQDQFLKK